MKSALFYIFYSENKKIYYTIKSELETLEEICPIFERRLILAKKHIIDLGFDNKVKESIKIKSYNKYGVLDFLGDEYRGLLLRLIEENEPSGYYQGSEESENSKYELDLIQLNSFLSAFKRMHKNNLQEFRKKIKITRLFG
jgi:hypothetical protein